MQRSVRQLAIKRRKPLRVILIGTLGLGILSLGSCSGHGTASTSGAGGGTGGHGNGGGGVANAPVISLVTPSSVMVGAGLGEVTVIGYNFTPNSQVIFNASAANTIYQSSTKLLVQPAQNPFGTPGTYPVSVQDPNGKSNHVSVTVYSPVQGPQPFSALSGYSTGAVDSQIAIGDIDGDGLDDVIVNGPTIGNSPNIAILRGQRDGTLAAPKLIPGAATVYAVGDVNGDGTQDIIASGVSNASGGSFSILLNDGKGNFKQGLPLSYTGAYPNVKLANILGNGRNDLLVATSAHALYLFPNQGGGSFGAPITIANVFPNSFVVADFDGDGRLDVAYSGLDPVTGFVYTHLLVNRGNGTFNDVVPAALANAGGRIVVGDFNVDGLPDLAVESTSETGPITVQVFLNQGNLNFSSTPQSTIAPIGSNPFSLVVGDFDHDGFPDLAGIGGGSPGGAGLGGSVPPVMMFLWGDGSGVLAPQYIPGPAGFYAAVGDINGDGIPDVVMPDRYFAVAVALGRKGRNFTQVTSISPEVASSISVADINGDGLPDLFFGGDRLLQTPGSIFINKGKGVFEYAGRPPSQAQRLADLNGDGKPDLIGFGNGISIWPGTGDPNYNVAPIVVQPPAGLSFAGFLTADLDGDGLPEIIGPEGIAWNKGNFQFDFQRIDFNGVYAIADVNNDGRLDLITRSGTFLNRGSRQFKQVADNGLPVGGSPIAMADFNGDGFLDAAITENVGVIIAYGRGDGTFYVQNFLTIPNADASFVRSGEPVVADFNGDGRPDIITATGPSPELILYTNDGHGGFQTSFFAAAGGIVVAADFNNDGKPDVAVLDFGGGPGPANALIVFAH